MGAALGFDLAPYSFSTPTISLATEGATTAATAAEAGIGATALMEAAPLAIPAAMLGAMYYTYKHPESTAYSRGKARAQQEQYARQAREEAAERAEAKAKGLAYNETLAKYYEKELANGPIIMNYTNGNVGIIDSYNPNNGTFTGSIHYPSGSYMSGTFPHADYYHQGGVDYNDLVDATITYPNKGVFEADLRGFWGDTGIYDPGLLVQGLVPKVEVSDSPFAEYTSIPITQAPLEGNYMSRGRRGAGGGAAAGAGGAAAGAGGGAAGGGAPRQGGNQGNGNRGRNRNRNNKNQNQNESEFFRNFKQGWNDQLGTIRFGYNLGRALGWIPSHPFISSGIALGLGTGGYYLHNALNSEDPEKGPNESDQTVNTSGVNGATTGTTGTVIYNPDQIPTDSTSTRPVAWPY